VEGTLLHVNRPATIVWYNASMRVGMFCALVIPTLLHLTLTTTVAIWMADAGVMWVIALWLMFSTVRGLPFAWHREMLGEEWKFSLPLAAVSILGISSNYIDRFLVSHQFGAAAFGIYTNGTIEIPTVTMVTNTIAVVLMAEFSRLTSRGDHAAVLPIWHRAMVKTSIFIFASLGFLAFWGHEVMRILFSARFAASGDIFTIYVWIVPLFLFAMQPLYVSLGATRILIAITAFDLLLAIILTPLGGYYFGIIGMAFGAILARYIGTWLWIHWYVRWLTNIGWRAFMPWGKTGLALVLAVLAGGLSRLLHLWLAPRWPEITLVILAGIGYLALYLSGLHLARLLPFVLPTRRLPARIPLREEVPA
jgi:O-antigen/teichoic acid export membrane protein